MDEGSSAREPRTGNVAFEPPTADVANLLIRMTELEWPTTEGDRLRFFHRLGLHDIDGSRSDDSDLGIEYRQFHTAMPSAVHGTANMFRGEFLGLSLFLYDEPVENGLMAREGYRVLREQLSQRLGPPVEEWGVVNEPACLWRPGLLLLDMYCFQRRPSGIMVGPSHAERSAALDAAAEGNSLLSGHLSGTADG
jgi:hypothetical protein